MLARRLCSIGTALFAALRAAVPTGGRRSRACASLRLVAWAPVGGAGRHARSVGPRNGVPPPAKTAGRPGNADLRSVLPVGAGTRGSAKPAPMTVRRTDVSGAPPAKSGLRCSLRFAQRCRPEVGVPVLARRLCSTGTALFAALRAAVPTGGRRSLAGASLVLNRNCAVRCASRSGADRRSAFPCRRVACAQPGLRCSLRFAQRCRPEVGVPVLARRLCSTGTALFAALRAAVPTGGRRSLAGASLVLNRDCAVRCASRSGADQRSAFPCRRVACAQPGLRCSLRFAQRCRPEVGVPLPARRLCSTGTALFAALRAAVPTGGRRSLAGASLVLNRDCAVRCASRSGADQRPAFPCRRVACAQPGLRCSLRFAQRCRPEVGVPVPARRLCSMRTALFAALRAAVPTRGRRSLAGASLVLNEDCAVRCASRSGADQRSAFPCRRVACAQSGLRRSPRGAGRCRPEVGVPLLARRSAW